MARTALLIIDMQNDIAHPDGRMFIRDAAHRAEAMGLVLDAFREARAPVVHAVRSHRSDGWDVERFRMPSFEAGRGICVEGTWGRQILDRFSPEPGEPVVVKRRFSAFLGTELDMLLRRARVTKVAVCGVSLPNSPRATMFDAVSLDYDVICVEDGMATANDETRIANLRDLEAVGVRVATAQELIAETYRAAERAASVGPGASDSEETR
ncbi:MAG: isochorismatase family cysteine hydrolase [Actinomycetota bacterium]